MNSRWRAVKSAIIGASKERGYIVIVMHVGVEGPDVSVARVLGRTEEGGHAVPEDKKQPKEEEVGDEQPEDAGEQKQKAGEDENAAVPS